MHGRDTASGWVTGSILGTDAEGRLVAVRAELEVVAGPDAGAKVELEAGTLTLGGHPTCGLRLTDGTVSRRHAEVALLGNGVRVRDLDSKNGTFVGGTRIEDATMPMPFELRVGSTRVAVRSAELPVSVPPSERTRFGRLVGRSPTLRRAFGVLERAARTDAPILLCGPAGVGKTAFCVAAHEASGRAGPLLFLDPTRELDRDAITHAMRAADGGTLILEHVERWPRDGMEALVATLDEGRGGADVRLLATAREDLRRAVEEGRFPRPLFFFLATLRVDLPPLAERPEDVQPMIDQFLSELGQPGMPIPEELGQQVGRGLRGDARELRGLVEAAVARRAPPASAVEDEPPTTDASAADRPYHEAKAALLDAFERRYLTELMARHDGVILHAAEEAGLGRNHFARLLKKHDLK